MRTVVLGVVGVLVLGGCACRNCGCGEGDAAAVVAEASGAEKEAFDKIKGLAGTWEGTGPDGSTGTITYSVSSGGSSVREVMFPGADHEMTNMYHLDGDSVVMTHYCAVGNQPRMRARGVADPGVIEFTFDSVTNRTSADQTVMGSMKLTIVDADHIRQEWTSFGSDHGPVAFELTRKK